MACGWRPNVEAGERGGRWRDEEAAEGEERRGAAAGVRYARTAVSAPSQGMLVRSGGTLPPQATSLDTQIYGGDERR